MAELRTLLWKKKIAYSGLIDVKGVYRVAHDWLSEQGYNPYEEKHTEQNFEDGKEIIVEMKGEKDLSDFAKIKWKTKITCLKLKETVVERDNQRVKMYSGEIEFSTDLFLATDYDKSFEQRAFMYFLRTVIDRFVFKSYINKSVDRAKAQYKKFQDTIKSYLNMENFY
jgi:hypothetical protein